MAAAQALLCRDILSLVFDQFDPGPVPVHNSLDGDMYRTVEAERRAGQLLKGTLTQCARVCHAFSGPALDALWRNMHNLGDVLSALPSFRRKNKDADAFYKSRFEGLITQEEWARFRQYAARVRSLSMGSACHQDGSVWVFLTIWCTHSSRPLLPNLARLDLAIDTCAAHAFTILLSPSHKSLVLSVNDMIAQPYWDMVMELLKPYLKHVASIALHPDESSDWPEWQVWAGRMPSKCALQGCKSWTSDMRNRCRAMMIRITSHCGRGSTFQRCERFASRVPSKTSRICSVSSLSQCSVLWRCTPASITSASWSRRGTSAEYSHTSPRLSGALSLSSCVSPATLCTSFHSGMWCSPHSATAIWRRLPSHSLAFQHNSHPRISWRRSLFIGPTSLSSTSSLSCIRDKNETCPTYRGCSRAATSISFRPYQHSSPSCRAGLVSVD
ncbi:hypothetical protein BD413DRAFT_193302 [Trametes elegans]|nr:hypothetical protein BD413DRAFT_193302 [Trametes elegans]